MRINKRYIYGGLLCGIFLVSVALSYYGPVRYRFVIPPGDDVVPHLQYIQMLSDGGLSLYFSSGYSLGFHGLVLLFSRLTHLSFMESMVVVAPAILPLSGLAIWLLAKQIYGRRVALIALALFSLVSLQPLQTYFDGSLPNLFTAGLLVPLMFSALIWSVNTQRKVAGVSLTLLLLLGVFLSHHLTTLVCLFVLIPWTLLVSLYVSLRTKRIHIILTAVMGLLLLGSVILRLFQHLQILYPARSLLYEFIQFSPHFPYVTIVSQSAKITWNSEVFGTSVGGLIFQAGWAGIAIGIYQWRKRNTGERLGTLLLSIWFLLYFYGAAYVSFGEPERMGRDLALPASILAAAAVDWSFHWLKKYYSELAVAFLIVVICLSGYGFWVRIRIESSYPSMLRFSSADKQAYEYLVGSGISDKTTILVQEPSWETVTNLRGDSSNRFYSIQGQVPLQDAPWSRCYLVGWFSEQIWPKSFSDHTVAQTYLSSDDLQQLKRFSDPNKTWFLLCRQKSE